MGYRGRLLIRTDGEPALVALRAAVLGALPEGATPLKTPGGERQAALWRCLSYTPDAAHALH